MEYDQSVPLISLNSVGIFFIYLCFICYFCICTLRVTDISFSICMYEHSNHSLELCTCWYACISCIVYLITPRARVKSLITRASWAHGCTISFSRFWLRTSTAILACIQLRTYTISLLYALAAKFHCLLTNFRESTNLETVNIN